MNELGFQEEWLSAYLDDELTPDQRQVVEQRLASDPAAQAMLEDLRRVRALVAKLPSWSGDNLKFTVPAELPGSFDDAADLESDDEFNDEIADELDDFEEVPRSLAGVEEPRIAAAAPVSWNLPSRISRSMLGWIATAASVLLVAGLGLVFWPAASQQVAQVNTQLAQPMSAAVQPAASEPGRVRGLGRADEYSIGDEAVSRANVATSSDEPAPLDAKLMATSPADTLALSVQETRHDEKEIQPEFADKQESKMKTADASSTLGGVSGGMGGGGSNSELGLAMKLPANAPSAELPPPAPMNAARSIAPPETELLNESLADYAQREASLLSQVKAESPAVYFARSQSWMDQETQSSLQYGTNLFSVNSLAFGNSLGRQHEADQRLREGHSSDSVLMAAIRPEIANSPDFFSTMIASNQLIAVDQQTGVNESKNVPGKLDAFSKPRFQYAMPGVLQSNSFILFVNRDEANRILTQLQEKGQISSQVWRVIKPSETEAVAGKKSDRPPITPQQQSVDSPSAGVESNGRAEPNGAEKVILMLNGPPY